MSWRQTGGCDPDGPRESDRDKSCFDIVPSGASGYCECGGGIIKMKKRCMDKLLDTCFEACGGTSIIMLKIMGNSR